MKTTTSGESDATLANRTSGPILADQIGRRIGEVARELGTRKSAAEAMGISADSLQRYIRGENMPPFDVTARLCLAANVRMEWLATGIGEMHNNPWETAVDGASQPVRPEGLMLALQLADEALKGKVLPPVKYAELVIVLYELLEEGLSEAKVRRFAHTAA